MNCKTILIVEDESDASTLLGRALRAKGFKSEVAENGQAALDFLEKNPEPCIVLLDLMMPVMSGQEFRAKQAANPKLASIPIVVVSAADDIASETKRMGVSTYVKKPVEMGKLLPLVQKHCAHDHPEHS